MPEQILLTSALELHLKRVARSQSAKFPRRGGKYFEHYVSMKQHLADKYYSNTGSALAAEQGDRFTKHDISHVDDVIGAASQMLGFDCEGGSANQNNKILYPYEVYVLLLAILLHDAGNAVRRSGHEKLASEILREISVNTGMNNLEKSIIANIAQAHGGALDDGNKETITALMSDPEPNIGSIKIRAWKLAALVRLADELSENPTRADESAIANPKTSDLSLLANYYCLCINGRIDFPSESVHLDFYVDRQLLPRVFKVPDGKGGTSEIMFVDYIAERLEKCERERRYCHRFLAGFAGYVRIRVKLVIMDADTEIDSIALDLEEVGYPALTKSVKESEPQFDGRKLRDKHCAAVGEETRRCF